MEIFVSEICQYSVTPPQLKRAIADVLHGQDFEHYHTLPLNFDVRFHTVRDDGTRTAILTVPNADIGEHFLEEFGGYRPREEIRSGGDWPLKFRRGRHPPRQDLVYRLERIPYVDPQAEEDQLSFAADLRDHLVHISTVQFGRRCKDNVFSNEYELFCNRNARMSFDGDRRQFRLKIHQEDRNVSIVFRASQISSTYLGKDTATGLPVIHFALDYPPSYEEEKATDISDDEDLDFFDVNPPKFDGPSRTRLLALDEEHEVYAAHASLSLRILCQDDAAMENFEWICDAVHLPWRGYSFRVERRNILAPDVVNAYDNWLPTWSYEIAFQLDAIAKANVLDLKELLGLGALVKSTRQRRGDSWTASLIRFFHAEARDWPNRRHTSEDADVVQDLFRQCRNTFIAPSCQDTCEETFECYHAKVTPSRVLLEGPFPERSNRVMRKYSRYTSNFLRVSFMDENLLQCRFDREVDGHEFIEERFGGVLLEGLTIAGRHFELLAYSQSGLKQHSVWFMKRFRMQGEAPGSGQVVTMSSVINDLGLFSHDAELIRCPARYGARIAQAFTTTEAAVEIEVDEMFEIDDVMDEDGYRSFTEGIGTMSEELAQDIWRALQQKSVRHRRYGRHIPKAIQIRFQGYKGMLSVNHRLKGRAICLRPSMKKFEAPGSMTIEVAGIFNKPARFYLNRYLIMLLEGLVVRGGYRIFEQLQEAVIQDTKDATKSFQDGARLCEEYGLGTAFKLTSVFLDLAKLGVQGLTDVFSRRVLNFVIYHILRDLKYQARIPVPGGYTLVGVADIHQYLGEGEIFACVSRGVGEDPVYLEGPTMIARSPTIHPGDVQVVQAIGRPPKGSVFDKEPLMNTVVFSTLGTRPLASCLAGGDLDGDAFVCSTLEGLMPTRTYHPADYDTAERKTLNRPSQREDVAEFITEYLYSDNIGLIASFWLTTADQSDEGILDPDCLRLAELHSNATDYPKSGLPVPMTEVPRPKMSNMKPDWNAPEMAESTGLGLYYQSQRYIGRLYREIQLSVPQSQRPPPRTNQAHIVATDSSQSLLASNFIPRDDIEGAVYKRVSEFIDADASTTRKSHQLQDILSLFTDYVESLRQISVAFNIAHKRAARLTEEEIVAGTIIAQSSQPRIRKNAVSRMREQASILVNRIAAQFASSDEDDKVELLERAWIAYRVSDLHPDAFGSRSFGIIAMHEIFHAIKSIEAAASK